jgi:hypothetical protein
MIRIHNSRQRVFSNFVMNHQFRYKAQKSGYNNSYLDRQNSFTGFDWPKRDALTFEQENPLWLNWLRRLADISSIVKELRPTLASQPSIRFVDKSNMSLPPFKIEDLKIIGYTAYVCEECLVSTSVDTLFE